MHNSNGLSRKCPVDKSRYTSHKKSAKPGEYNWEKSPTVYKVSHILNSYSLQLYKSALVTQEKKFYMILTFLEK